METAGKRRPTGKSLCCSKSLKSLSCLNKTLPWTFPCRAVGFQSWAFTKVFVGCYAECLGSLLSSLLSGEPVKQLQMLDMWCHWFANRCHYSHLIASASSPFPLTDWEGKKKVTLSTGGGRETPMTPISHYHSCPWFWSLSMPPRSFEKGGKRERNEGYEGS